MSDYDSTNDTRDHISRVQALMADTLVNLTFRASAHDKSKFEPIEKEVFDRMTPKLKASTYGSEEYKGFLGEMQVALRHHYANNSHHPEHWKLWKCPLCKRVFPESETREANVYKSKPRFCPSCCPMGSLFEATLEPHISVDGMSLLDVLEMLCDWKAASERHANGSIHSSIDINEKRFEISSQLAQILRNTAKEMGW